MTYTIDDIPIYKKNNRIGTVVIGVLCCMLFLPIAIIFPIMLHESPFYLMQKRLSYFVCLAASVIIPIVTLRSAVRRAELTIDEAGVQTLINGKRKNFGWNDIKAVNTVSRGPRRQISVVKIIRKTEPLYSKEDNIIWCEFDMTADELCLLIRAGVAKFGEPDADGFPLTR